MPICKVTAAGISAERADIANVGAFVGSVIATKTPKIMGK